MRAVRFHGYQGLDSVRLEDAPDPVAKDGEILVRVHAAGVNPFDWYSVAGYVKGYVDFALPTVMGRDFSGVVAALGAGVSGFRVGDAVYGHVAADADGAFADYVAVPASRVAAKPEILSHAEAASLPNVLMAAWDGLFSATSGLDLQPGQTVLINGAAGGIGSIALQLAQWRGARATGTASAGNLDLVRELGAVAAHDYNSEGWEQSVGEIDGVLDMSDGSAAERLCALIRPGGRYVAMRGLPSTKFAYEQASKGIACLVANGPASAHLFPDMATAIAQRAAKPVVTACYPLDQFARALEGIRTGHMRGKLVLEIAG